MYMYESLVFVISINHKTLTLIDCFMSFFATIPEEINLKNKNFLIFLSVFYQINKSYFAPIHNKNMPL